MDSDLLNDVKNLLKSSCEKIDLDLSNQGLSDNDVERLVDLVKQYPGKDIRHLNLYCNDITDKGAKQLSSLENIVELDIGYNRIKNLGAKCLVQNSKIKGLSLSDNNITDDCVEFIIKTTKQVYLNLENNKIRQENLDKIKLEIKRNSMMQI